MPQDTAKKADPSLLTDSEREAIICDLSISVRKGSVMLGCSDKTLWKWRQDRGLNKASITTTVSAHAPKLLALPNGRPKNEERQRLQDETGASKATINRDLAEARASSPPTPAGSDHIDLGDSDPGPRAGRHVVVSKLVLVRDLFPKTTGIPSGIAE